MTALPSESAAPVEATPAQHPPAAASARPSNATTTTPERLPPFAVVLHNDDVNTFEFVVSTLKRVFHYNTAHAFMLTMRAHRAGRTAVWTGQKEHAEFKADQIKACGPDPAMSHRGSLPLRVSIQPLPKP